MRADRYVASLTVDEICDVIYHREGIRIRKGIRKNAQRLSLVLNPYARKAPVAVIARANNCAMIRAFDAISAQILLYSVIISITAYDFIAFYS